jgi:mediator of replication checkpoint protein 1
MEKQKRLAAVKQALIAHRKKNPPILELNSEDDDGLDVVDEEDAKGKLSFTPSHRKVPDARMALSRASGAAAPSRARQQISRFAGKAAAKHSITETHADFAGRQFSHAQLKNANGRSRPAGQKKGRDEVITHGQVDNQNLARHMEHVHKIKQSKEQLYGSSRELPAKRALDITTLVSSSHESAKGNAASDDDDSDFAPSGDEEGSDAEDLGTGPSAIQDTLPEDDEQEDEDGNADEDEDKENQPVPVVEQDDEEENPFKARATATRRRQVVTSDDEGDGQDQVRDTSLREAVKSQPTKAQTQIAGGDDRFGEEIDFGGFGSAGGGFSQLFGATQAPDGGDDADAFAALRNAPELPLLPEHALLPSVRISETQKRRDDALIAGEFENASLPTPKTVKKKQYLNSQGYVTCM